MTGADAMAVDSSNNVIVTGYSAGSEGDYDYATIKYSSAGVPLWTNRYNGPANSEDEPIAVAVDGSNNVIVTGYSLSAYGRLYRLRDNQVFERGGAALDQPLQRAGDTAMTKPVPWPWTAATT